MLTFLPKKSSKPMNQQPYNFYEPYKDVMYRLTGYIVGNAAMKSYPCFNIYRTEESIHRTYKDASAKMLNLIENAGTSCRKYHSFYIAEVPVGATCTVGSGGQKVWSFTGSGKFNAHGTVSEIEDVNGNDEIFWGREEKDCRFKVGDIVEVPTGLGEITLGIICRLPESFEEVRLTLPEEKPDKPLGYHRDYTDDAYQVLCIFEDFPDYYSVVRCFAPETFCLDSSYVDRLREILDNYIKATR